MGWDRKPAESSVLTKLLESAIAYVFLSTGQAEYGGKLTRLRAISQIVGINRRLLRRLAMVRCSIKAGEDQYLLARGKGEG